jgi:hypothetical protein
VLSEILMRGDVHDETLAEHLVSVTEVRMSPDLRHATVFVKPLLGQDEEVVLKALRTHTAYLQREVARGDHQICRQAQIPRRRKLRRGRPHRRDPALAQGRQDLDGGMIRAGAPDDRRHCRAEPMTDAASPGASFRVRRRYRHLAALRSELRPEGFRPSFDRIASLARNRFVLFDGDRSNRAAWSPPGCRGRNPSASAGRRSGSAGNRPSAA